MDQVHVGIQIRREAAQLVRADACEAVWETDVEVVERDGALDFRGPAVQGKVGERFIYLTWGNVHPGDRFEMFRRAKLMLSRVDREFMESAVQAGCISVAVDLTDDLGGPRCARLDPPAAVWRVPDT